MKRLKLKLRWQATSFLVIFGMVLAAVAPLMSEPSPAWWSTRGVTNEHPLQNLSVANLGQLKHIATQMYGELDDLFPDGAGYSLAFANPPANPEAEWYSSQRTTINLGQLKAVAKPIYDRLNAISPSWVESQLRGNGLSSLGTDYFQDTGSGYFYPWNPSTPVEANYKLVTIGQLKLVFALKLKENTDGDSLPDLWEYAVLLSHPETGFTAITQLTDETNTDGDLLTALQEYQYGTDPFSSDSNHDGLSDSFQLDLAGKWKLDEGAGNLVVTDSSGHGIGGELISGTRISDGISGGAVSLLATQHIKITPTPGQLNVGNNGSDFSVSFWIRLHTTRQSGWNSILQKGDTSSQRTFHLSLRPDNLKLHARLTSSASINEGIDSSVTELVPRRWTHVSYVHGGGQLKLYINGQFDSSAPVSSSIANDAPFFIGKSAWLRGVNADFDELQIHRRALTSTEVNQLAGVDSDGDGSNDQLEVAAETDPNDSSIGGVDDRNTDSDGDTIMNAFDAVHDDAEINWKKTPECSYVWMEIAELDSIVNENGNHNVKVESGDELRGHPVALNSQGQVLFSRGLWNMESASWSILEWSGSLAVEVLGQNYDYNEQVFQLKSMNETGTIVGISEIGTNIGVRAGMIWKKDADGKYSTPEYFLKKISIQSDEDGIIDIGGISKEGVVQCVASGYDFSLFDSHEPGNEVAPVSPDIGGGGFGDTLYRTGATLDTQGIGWRDTLIQPTGPDDIGGYRRELILRDGTSLDTVDSKEFIGFDSYGDMPEASSSGISSAPALTQSRLWIASGDRVFLEKTDSAAEDGRWHNPPSMSGGAIRVNEQGIAMSTTQIWKNGKYRPLDQIIAKAGVRGLVSNVKAIDISNNGLILAQAKIDGIYKAGVLLPIEVVELAPMLKDEAGAVISGSDKPIAMPKYNELVEEIKLEKQYEQNRIAHREIKVKITGGKYLAGKKVTWTMRAWGVKESDAVRGDWKHSKIKEHKNCFEESKVYGKYWYNLVDQKSSRTKIEALDNDGFAVIRVNLPPIGWNHAEVKIKVEGIEEEISVIRFIVPAVIVIDPGHGGDENIGKYDKDKNGLKRGSSSHNNAKGGWWSVKKTVNGKSRWVDEKSYPKATGILEKTLTLEYGVKLLELLRIRRKKDKLSLMIYMTREGDNNLGGYERTRLARDKGTDVFFSIHFNSASNKSARGALIVIRENGNKNFKEDRTFANRFSDKVAKALVKHDTTARKTARDPSIQSNSMTSDILGFYQDKEYHPIRATIIEVEFIHGEGGDKLINGPSTKDKVKQSVAEAIRDGILEELNKFKVQND